MVGDVEVGLLDFNGLIYWEYTNYGTEKERYEALDEVRELYNLEN